MFYADLARGTFYQLKASHKGSRLQVLKGFGEPLTGTTEASFDAKAKTWYRFRIRVKLDEQSYTRIKARIWADDGKEPDDWMIDAKDKKNPLTAGTIALFASSDDTWFDEFQLKALRLGDNKQSPCR